MALVVMLKKGGENELKELALAIIILGFVLLVHLFVWLLYIPLPWSALINIATALIGGILYILLRRRIKK